MIPDQQKHWNQIFAKKQSQSTDQAGPFARTVVRYLKMDDYVLELGCGTGADARFFAQTGVQVIATDFSDEVIAQNSTFDASGNPIYQTMNIDSSYPFENETFNVVYAHLSLHYYSDHATKNILREIHRVLKPGGLLLFRCKSTKDVTYGQGEEIAPNTFVRNGHLRHLFTPDYARDLMQNFTPLLLEETTGEYDNVTSHFIDCVAQK